MIAVDTNFLIALFDGDKFPNGTIENTLHVRAKSVCLAAKEQRVRIIIPYVALTEYLEGVQKPEVILESLKKDRRFTVASYDAKATLEYTHLVKSNKDFKKFGKIRNRQGLKFDAQILAISLANNATHFCSRDEDLLSISKSCGLTPCHLDNFEIDEAFRQLSMSFPEPTTQSSNEVYASA